MKKTDIKNAAYRARTTTKTTNEAARSIESAVVAFRVGDRSIDFNIDVTGDTVWATQQQIADLFGKDVNTIGEHIQNALSSGELDGATTRKFRVVRQEGAREVARDIEHYDLDVIFAVGIRAKSPQAIAFRKWAFKVLKSYVTKGYALNEQRLARDPAAADDLATRLRRIRSSEQHRWAKVCDYFKETATDYDSKSPTARSFFALQQDKCHFAAAGRIATDIILDRVDHKQPNMGLQTFQGELPTLQEAKVAKNYLAERELKDMDLVNEMFLLFVDAKTNRGQSMTMATLSDSFDAILQFNGYEVFPGYRRGEYKRKAVDKHVAAEMARFLVRQRPKLQVARP